MSRPADPRARAALIAAARKEFWRHGIQKARIEDITSASGLSKGAFYLHFESKEALFRELVAQLTGGMDALLEARRREEEAMFERSAAVKKNELETEGPRVQALQEHNRRCDGQVLELLWAHRDLAYVLINGAQNTEFNGLIWALVDREAQRIKESFERLKKWGYCRSDVPIDAVSAMLMGSWLLLVRRMTLLREKPNFESWLDGMSRLLESGIWAPELAAPPANPRRRRLRSLP